MESFLNEGTLSEAEVVRVVLAFLEDRGLYLSLDALERESGGLLAQGQLPPKTASLRRLVVGGKWTEAAASLRSLLPEPNAALFHLMRQKYLELICVYEELGNDMFDDLGHAVALCFSELSACCPSPEERDELRRLARLSRPTRDPSMRNWDPLSGRRRCFEALLPLLGSLEETPPKTESPVDPSRLTDLIAKGLLYEAENGPLPVDILLEPMSRREATDEGWTEIILMRSEGEEWPGRENFMNRRIQDGLVDGAPEILRRAEEIIGRWEARYRPVVSGGGDSTVAVEGVKGSMDLKKEGPSREENVDTRCAQKVEDRSSTAKEEGVVERGLPGESKARRALKGKKKSSSKLETKVQNLQPVANRVLKDVEIPSREDAAKVKRNLPSVENLKCKEKPSMEEEAQVKRNLTLVDHLKDVVEKPSRKKEAKSKRNLPLVDQLKDKEKPYIEEEAQVKRNLILVDHLLKDEEKPSKEKEAKAKRNFPLVDPPMGKVKTSTKKEVKIKRNLPLADQVKDKVDKSSIGEEGEVKRELPGFREPELDEEENVKCGYPGGVGVGIPSSYGAVEKQTVRDLLQAKDRVREKLLKILNNDRKDSKQ